MSKIVIVGSSLAAIAAIEAIRAVDHNREIILFSPEGVLPYDRTLLPQWMAKQAKEAHLQPKSKSFFEQHKVNVVTNEQLVRISVKRRQITMESKTHISYEKLLLLDLGRSQFQHVRGNHKKGLFDCVHYASVRDIQKALPFVDNVVVEVTGFQGLNMACALIALKKEVSIICPGSGVLSGIFDDETASLLKQIVEGKGIRVIPDNTIEEILGDSDTKAVKLKSGKVIAAEMVIFDDVLPDVKPLAESSLTEGSFIPVDNYFKTSLPEIYAADLLCSGYNISSEESRQQGLSAGANLVAEKTNEYVQPLSSYVFGLDVLDGFASGIFRLGEEGREYLKFDGPQNIYKKIFAQGNHLLGTVLFNATDQQEKIVDAMRKGTDITGAEESLLG